MDILLDILLKPPQPFIGLFLSYRLVFLESTKVSASEEPNALEKAPAQFMLLWKLSRKFHF